MTQGSFIGVSLDYGDRIAASFTLQLSVIQFLAVVFRILTPWRIGIVQNVCTGQTLEIQELSHELSQISTKLRCRVC